MTANGVDARRDDAAAWLAVRDHLRSRRLLLSAAASASYPDHQKVERTDLLTRPVWFPQSPVPLAAIGIELQGGATPPIFSGLEAEAVASLPTVNGAAGHGGYSQAMAELARPTVFEDRPVYRLLEADLAGPSPSLRFGEGRYFQAVDVGEACAHEAAAADRDGRPTPFRDLIGDPCDLSRRCAPLAISALTIRIEPASQRASFPLHWRDPKLVAHAAGMYHVLPAGVFQAAGPGPVNRAADFDLWLGLLREYAEEMAGWPEVTATSEHPVDYAGWPFARGMQSARAEGRLRLSAVGIGVDPLTFATDLLVVAVFDADVYDELFGAGPAANEEGKVLSPDGQRGFEFDEATIGGLVREAPMQPAGAALLALAWRHRRELLGFDPTGDRMEDA